MNFLMLMAFAGLFLAFSPSHASAADGFSAWLADLRVEAGQKGISKHTIQTALSGLTPNPRVVELDGKQPEGRLSFAEYQNNVVTKARIAKGRELYRMHRRTLDATAAKYGVPPEIIVALWGIETSYGKNSGGFETIEALATLAYDGRRSDFFRGELFNALTILDEGHIDFKNMTGSWAGAMGQNQFMPSSFLKFAVDGNGDGRRDIWRSLPDVFASTANYLKESGWQAGQRWGREVKVSQHVPEQITGINAEKSIVEWSQMGVTLPNGDPLPTVDGMYASLVFPDGTDGPAFLVYNNYRIIMKWNKSKYFATSVGLLADEIARGAS